MPETPSYVVRCKQKAELWGVMERHFGFQCITKQLVAEINAAVKDYCRIRWGMRKCPFVVEWDNEIRNLVVNDHTQE